MKDKRNIFQRIFNKQIPEPSGFKGMQFHDLPKANWTLNNSKKYIDETYQKNVIAYRCIKEIADSIGTVQWELYNDKDERILTHPLLSLIKRPNPLTGASSLIQQIQIFKQTTGNAFIHAVRPSENRPPKELHVLPSTYMSVKAGNHGMPYGYEYNPGNTGINKTFYKVDAITGSSDILHYKFFNPSNPYWGQSPIQSAAYSVDLHNEASVWNMKLLQNGARPSGGLFIDKQLSDEQRKYLKEAFDEAHTGAGNAGKPMLFEGGFEWKDMALSPKDMDYLRSKNVSAREIATAYRIPPQLLNINGDNTYANMAEARLSLWEDTLLPEVNMLRDELNNWLVPMFGPGLRLSYNKSKIIALSVRREKIWYALSAATFLTVNEQREIAGFEPIPGGDAIYKNSGEIPAIEKEEV